MRRFLKYLIVGLGATAVLAVGIWIAVNAWPRSMEAELWTEANLPLDEPEADIANPNCITAP